MNSSVQTQRCNFRLPTPFPNKNAVTRFPCRRSQYGFMGLFTCLAQGGVGCPNSAVGLPAAVPGGRAAPHLAPPLSQCPAVGLPFSFLLQAPLQIAAAPPRAANLTADIKARAAWAGAPPWWQSPGIFSISKPEPLVSSPRVTRARANSTGCKSRGCLNFHHLPSTWVSQL